MNPIPITLTDAAGAVAYKIVESGGIPAKIDGYPGGGGGSFGVMPTVYAKEDGGGDYVGGRFIVSPAAGSEFSVNLETTAEKYSFTTPAGAHVELEDDDYHSVYVSVGDAEGVLLTYNEETFSWPYDIPADLEERRASVAFIVAPNL